MMSCLFLLNDLNTAFQDDLLLGDSSVGRDSVNAFVSETIAANISDLIAEFPAVEELIASDDERLATYIHKLRFDSRFVNLPVRWSDSLRERKFGVLNKTAVFLDNSIFTHSRILPEGGESLRELSDRVMPIIKSINKVTMIISHPFVCQIAFNILAGQLQTLLSDFWINQRGSCAILYNSEWTFYNADMNTYYSMKEIIECPPLI